MVEACLESGTHHIDIYRFYGESVVKASVESGTHHIDIYRFYGEAVIEACIESGTHHIDNSRFYGEAVVEACVESGTHHVDISGEPAFLEKMQLKYHQKVNTTIFKPNHRFVEVSINPNVCLSVEKK